jgi:hypothetical protein
MRKKGKQNANKKLLQMKWDLEESEVQKEERQESVGTDHKKHGNTKE